MTILRVFQREKSTISLLSLLWLRIPASSKRLQISRWFAEGYALHLLIIAGMVNGLQVQA